MAEETETFLRTASALSSRPRDKAVYEYAAACVRFVQALDAGEVILTQHPATLHYTTFGFGASLTQSAKLRDFGNSHLDAFRATQRSEAATREGNNA